ncbi:hypothetical protein GCM10020220_054620 [Nonomuraea rubra]|uniref:epoxide hydrolase N-terminal domain-containing protein n=1 Tax=Nonomuraea rubra TaxID=46180 RepID=UPI0031ECA06B
MSDRVTPFRLDVPEPRTGRPARTAAAHRAGPRKETAGDWSQGVPLDYLRELCRYWPMSTTGGPPNGA